jgi:hypothetical protein
MARRARKNRGQAENSGMRDPWLQRGARRSGQTSADQMRQLQKLRMPKDVRETLQQWAASPAALEPLLRLIRAIVVSNAAHLARAKQARRIAGRARDPHYKQTPEEPGVLWPIRQRVDRVVADLEWLISWRFTPPIERHELDAKLKPTGRIVYAQLDAGMRAAFATARNALLAVRATLHDVTDRHRGRKVTLVQPFGSTLTARAARPTPARRRDLERLLRDELRRLHPDRTKRPGAARLDVDRLARRIGNSILPPRSRPRPRAGR